MSQYRPIRAGIALSVIGALTAAVLLPGEHIHPSLEGRVVVHRHAADHAADHPAASLDHADHHDARVLRTVFECTSPFAIDPAWATAPPSNIVRDWRLVGRVAPVDESACHDPPERFTTSRAPPISFS